METFLEQGAEPFVRLSAVGKQSIATTLGLVEDVQECGSRRLLLVGYVGMPRDRRGS